MSLTWTHDKQQSRVRERGGREERKMGDRHTGNIIFDGKKLMIKMMTIRIGIMYVCVALSELSGPMDRWMDSQARQSYSQTGRQSDREREKERDSQTEGQRDRQQETETN